MLAESRCPGSGMKMVPRTYRVRNIEGSDRAKWAQAEEARGELDMAEMTRESLRQWEREQGQEKEALVCPVCGNSWLTPTARGTSRPHRRGGQHEPSWDRVRQLRAAIQTLQSELDQELEALEDQATPE